MLQRIRPSDRAVGLAAILAGATLALVVQVLAPVGVPLYDGVVVQEPYRYLDPTGDQSGSPSSYSATPAVTGDTSPAFVAATTEVPAQAQLVLLADALVLTPGAASLAVSITPIGPPPVAPGGQLAGNVYRFTVTDQSGTPLAIKPCAGCASLAMRAPEDVTGEARLQRFADGAWSDVETIHAAITGIYATNPTVLGDYAIVTGKAPGSVGDAFPPGDVLVLGVAAGGVVLILIVAAVAALVVRQRRLTESQSAPAPVQQSRAVPSKRKGPKRPPPGSPRP